MATETDVLTLLGERRDVLAATDASLYINQKEVNAVHFLEQEIEQGRAAEKRAAAYFEFIENNEWSYVGFSNYCMEKGL